MSQWMNWAKGGFVPGQQGQYQTWYGAQRPRGGFFGTGIGRSGGMDPGASGQVDPNVQRAEMAATMGKGGDVLMSGPQSTDTSTTTLRAKYRVAGYDDIKSSELKAEQSDVLFETFSWVPDGYGLGPNNKLHQLNKQSDFIRFGTEEMFQPRMHEENNIPHGNQEMWQNDLPLSTIQSKFQKVVSQDQGEKILTATTRNSPLVIHEGDEWDASVSAQGLYRRSIQATKPIIQIQRSMYNRDQPCSAEFIPTPREMKLATWSSVAS
jgi:hypothetical protein